MDRSEPHNSNFRKSLSSLLTTLIRKEPVKRAVRRLVSYGIPTVTPEILAILPHDPNAFTQGLVFSEGLLYESTGIHGRSSLRCINSIDGRLLHMISLDDNVWGEGVVLADDRLVQLTWLSGKAFCFSLLDFKRIGEFSYDGEGWGITINRDEYIMSDGSHVLLFRDKDFKITSRLPVRLNRFALNKLNDIEYVDGMIYANVLYDTNVYVISEQTGRVTQIIDCSALVAHGEMKTSEQVLNGIAHDPEEKTFFMTGKQWRTLFKVRIPELPRDEADRER